MQVAATVENAERGFANAVRVHTALTAKIETRVLTWMAVRMPEAISPDHLTALGFASQMLAGGAYALSSRDGRFLWLVNFFLALNWFGDSLDGTLARVRNRQRPRYGFYVDHIADTFGALALMAGLGCSGYAHWEIAAGMLVVFLRALDRELSCYLHDGALSSLARPLWADGNSDSAGDRQHPDTQLSVREPCGPPISVLGFWRRNSYRGHGGDDVVRSIPADSASL